MSDINTTEPNLDGLVAMVDDNAAVITIVKKNEDGNMVYRHDGEWKPILDPRVFDELTLAGVAEGSDSIYDRYQADDKLVTIGHYFPDPEGPQWSGQPYIMYHEPEHEQFGQVQVDDGSEEEEEEAPILASVSINSGEDLEVAIAAASENPDLRWYVERRIMSLGLEADLPWLKD